MVDILLRFSSMKNHFIYVLCPYKFQYSHDLYLMPNCFHFRCHVLQLSPFKEDISDLSISMCASRQDRLGCIMGFVGGICRWCTWFDHIACSWYTFWPNWRWTFIVFLVDRCFSKVMNNTISVTKKCLPSTLRVYNNQN
jgi:hypothetical protein